MSDSDSHQDDDSDTSDFEIIAEDVSNRRTGSDDINENQGYSICSAEDHVHPAMEANSDDSPHADSETGSVQPQGKHDPRGNNGDTSLPSIAARAGHKTDEPKGGEESADRISEKLNENRGSLTESNDKDASPASSLAQTDVQSIEINDKDDSPARSLSHIDQPKNDASAQLAQIDVQAENANENRGSLSQTASPTRLNNENIEHDKASFAADLPPVHNQYVTEGGTTVTFTTFPTVVHEQYQSSAVTDGNDRVPSSSKRNVRDSLQTQPAQTAGSSHTQQSKQNVCNSPSSHGSTYQHGQAQAASRPMIERRNLFESSVELPHDCNSSILKTIGQVFGQVFGKKVKDVCEVSQKAYELFQEMAGSRSHLAEESWFFKQWMLCFKYLARREHNGDLRHVVKIYEQFVAEQSRSQTINDFPFQMFLYVGFTELLMTTDFTNREKRMQSIEECIGKTLKTAYLNKNFVDVLCHTNTYNSSLLVSFNKKARWILAEWKKRLDEEDISRWRLYVMLTVMYLVVLELMDYSRDLSDAPFLLNHRPNTKVKFTDVTEMLYSPVEKMHVAIAFLMERSHELNCIIPFLFTNLPRKAVPEALVCRDILHASNFSPHSTILFCHEICNLQWSQDHDNRLMWIDVFESTLRITGLSEADLQSRLRLWTSIFCLICRNAGDHNTIFEIYRNLLDRHPTEMRTLHDAMLQCLDDTDVTSKQVAAIAPLLLQSDRFSSAMMRITTKRIVAINAPSADDFLLVDIVYGKASFTSRIELLHKMTKSTSSLRLLQMCPVFASVHADCLRNHTMLSSMREVHPPDYPFDDLRAEAAFLKHHKQLPVLYLLHNLTLAEHHLNFTGEQSLENKLARIATNMIRRGFLENADTCSLFMAARYTHELNIMQTVFDLNKIPKLTELLQRFETIAGDFERSTADVVNSDLIEPYVESVRSNCASVRSKFVALVNRIRTKDITPSEFEMVTEELLETLEALSIPLEVKDVEDLSMDFVRAQEKYGQYCALLEWLKERDIQVYDVSNFVLQRATLASLWRECDAISYSVDQKLEKSVTEFLLSFLTPRSAIFNQVYESLGAGSTGKMTPQELGALVTEVGSFLHGLVDQDLPMSRLSTMLKAIGKARAAKFEGTWNNEVKRVTEFFAKGSSDEKTESLKQILNNIQDVTVFAENIGFVEIVLRELGIDLQGMDELHEISNTMSEYQNLLLSQLPEQLRLIKAIVGDISPDLLKYFEIVSRSLELVRFCRDPNFDDKLAVARGVAQGFAFDMNLLNQLQQAKAILNPLLHNQQVLSILQLCNSIFTDQNVTTNFEAKLQQLDEVCSNLAVLRDMFSPASELRSVIPTIKRARFFRIYSTETSIQLELVSENKEVNSAEMIETRLQTVKVFVDGEKIGEDREVINNFERCFDLAKLISIAFQELRVNGHPSYSSPEYEVGHGVKMEIPYYEETLQKLKNDLTTWTTALANASQRNPRLLLLSVQQIFKLLLKVKALLAQPSVTRAAVAANVLPYILIAYPECQSAGPRILTAELVTEAFRWATADLELPLTNEHKLSDSSLLIVIGNILTKIGAFQEIKDIIESLPANPSLPKRVLLFDSVPWSAHLMHVGLCGSIPRPAQILWADEHTTEAIILNYLDRALHFNHLPFIIHGVNRLVPSLRNFLSSWAAELSLNRNIKQYGAINLVFTANRGVDLFNFLEDLPSNSLSEQSFGEAFPASTILEQRCINAFHCLHSPEHIGKTTIIQNQMNNFSGKHLRITINENFTPSATIAQIVQAAFGKVDGALVDMLAPDVALHFDISSYAPLPQVSRFLDMFFYWGLLIDPYSGLVLHTMKHTDEQNDHDGKMRWKIFVEIGFPPTKDFAFNHLRTSADILERIPSVKHLMSASPLPVLPLLPNCNVDLEIIAKFEMALQNGAFPVHYKLLNAAPLQHTVVIQILEQLMANKNVRGWRFRAMFLSLLAERCNFFLKYWASNFLNWNIVLMHGAGVTEWQRRHYEAVKKLLNGVNVTYELLKDESQYIASVGKAQDHEVDDATLKNSLPLISAWEEFSDEDEQIKQMKFLSFGGRREELIASTPQDIFFCYKLVENAADPDKNWAMLRRDLAAALKIERTERMKRIIDQQHYILTEQFVAKLLIINARHQTRNNLILVGDTGQGKTELLNLYALIVNADTEIIPDILESMSSKIKQFCKDNHLFHVFTTIFETMTKQMLISQHFDDETTAKLIVSVVDDILAIESNAPELDDVPENFNRTSLYCEQLASVVLDYLLYILDSFPMVIRSEFMQEVVTAHSAHAADAIAMINDKHALKRLIDDILNIRFKTIFHRILMHKGISSRRLIDEVSAIAVACNEYPQVDMVLFIDEFNTTSVMGIMKEILVDRTLESRPLPENLFVIAAMNPSETRQDFQKEYDFAGGSTAQRLKTKFAVRPPHPSMEDLMFYFPNLKGADEESFVSAVVFLPWMSFVSNDERDYFKNLVIEAQDYIRAAKIKNMHPSIRDILRAAKIFNFFRSTKFGSTLISELDINDALKDISVKVHNKAAFSDHFWKALIMAMAMGYSFRLESGFAKEKHKWNRFDFGAKLQRILDRHPKFPNHLRFSNAEKVQKGTTVQEEALELLFYNSEISFGVAKTSALLENLFCIVVCVEMRMPLTICGPPGCSKTLAFTIACDNMKGPQTSPRPLYRLIGQMHRFRYQCSEFSTDAEVEGVFKNAISLQNTMNSTCSNSLHAGNCCVLLDEAGLPNEIEQPLKVLHHMQDHPQVASIVLTNRWLDPAKTNRTLQLLQTDPTRQDLQALVAGCLFGHKISNNRRLTAIANALHHGYQKIRDHHIFSLKFQLRDFVYFLRYLRRACLKTDGGDSSFSMTGRILLNALLRNFNGDLSSLEFETLAKFFFNALTEELETVNQSADGFGQMPNIQSRCIEPLRDSLNEQLSPDENINTSAFRYICLIDPTESEMGVALLKSLNLCSDCVVIRGSDFEEDNSGAGNTTLIIRMKNAMADGKTVILISASRIFGSFYDVFNKHFTVLTHDENSVGSSKSRASLSDRSRKEYYANVAVGAISRPCKVDPKFRLIVHLPASQLADTPAPFLNRFEKFELSIRHCLEEQMHKFRLSNRLPALSAAEGLLASCQHFVRSVEDDLVGMTIFQGLARTKKESPVIDIRSDGSTDAWRNDTVDSLVLRAIQLSTEDILEPPNITHVPQLDNFEEVKHNHVPCRNCKSFEWMQYLVRQCNFKLMQLIRPEAIYDSRLLNAKYMEEYLLRQNHLSVVLFLKYIIVNHSNQDIFEHAPRWCIYTRSSTELACLHEDSGLQATLNAFISQRSTDDNNDRSRNLSITVRSLSTITSLKGCVAMVEDFAKSTQSYLVITADMARCTHNQLNILRCELDERLDLRANKLVVIILHMSHEISTQTLGYPALFVENWDFLYIDSFGLSKGEEVQDEANHEISAVTLEKRKHVVDIDARKWLAHGYGFRFEDISPTAIEESFRSSLLERIATIVLNIPHIPPALSRKLLYSKDVYDPNRSPRSMVPRAQVLKTFFQDKKYLCNILLSKFAQMWCGETKESESILNSVIKSACLNIRNGNVTGSLAQSIRNSLQYVMFSIVRLALVNFLSNFNFEAIARIASSRGPNDDIIHDFLYAAARLIQPPAINEIFESGSSGEVMKKNLCDTALFIPMDINIIPNLPLYDLVAKSVMTHISSAQSLQKVFPRCAQQLCEHMRKSIDLDRDLRAVLELIREHPLLLTRFAEEFVHRTLKLPHLESPWLDFVVRVCHQLAAPYSEHIPTAVGLFLVKLFDEEAVATALSFVLPLRQLSPPPQIDEANIIIENYQFLKSMTPSEKMHLLNILFGNVSINLLWKRFCDCLSDDSQFEDRDAALRSWCRAFRELPARLSCQQQIMASLAEKDKSHYYVMLVAFKFIRQHGLESDFARRLLAQCLREYLLEQLTVAGLNDAIVLVGDIALALVNDPASELIPENTHAQLSITEDVISAFLEVSYDKNDDDFEFANSLQESLETLLRLYAQTDKNSPARKLVSLLSHQWLITTLFPLVSNKPANWTQSFRNVFGTIIQEDARGQTFDPFVPYISNLKVENLNALNADIERPLIIGESVAHPLQSLLFELLYRARLHLTAADFESGANPDPVRLSKLLQAYMEHASAVQPLQEADRIDLLAFGCVVLFRFAQQASVIPAAELMQVLAPDFRESLQRLLRPRDLASAHRHACPADGFCFFFENVRSMTHLNQLLQNQPVLEYLSLTSWKCSSNASDRKFFMFRFLQNERDPCNMGRLTNIIRSKLAEDIANNNNNLNNLLDFVEQKLRSSPQDLYNIRFVIILICYYDYFVGKSASVPFVLENLVQGSRLVQALKLDKHDINALRFAAKGRQILPVPERSHKVMEIYALQDENNDIAHLMFNILAVAFGTPPETNLLYGHVYHPQLGMQTYGPGSAYNRRNIDCGFVALATDRCNLQELQPTLQRDPIIVGNVYRHRCAINSMYWLSLVWSFEVDAAQATMACRAPHFINAIGEELFNDKSITVASPGVKEEHLLYYLFTRGQHFFELLSHSDLKDMNINSTHYLTEILLDIQHACNQTDRDPAWKDAWQSIDEVIPSEALFQRLFRDVEDSYRERRYFFVSDQAASEPRFELINRWQQLPTVKHMAYFPSINVFQEALGQIKEQVGPDTPESACIDFVEQFWNMRSQLAGANVMPRLIAFFQQLTELFSYRVTFEDTQNLTVTKAIKNVLRKLEPEAVANGLLQNWEDFKEDWNVVRSLVPQLEGCADVVGNRAFELIIPVVDDDSLLACFLQHPNVQGEYDYIRRLLSNIIDRQNNLLLARNNCQDVGHLHKHSGVPWNRDELLFDSDAAHFMPLSWLNNDTTAIFSLIVGDRSIGKDTARKTEFTELELFILAHMDLCDGNNRSNAKFDFRRIAEFVIQHYTCGRQSLQVIQKGLHMPFHYKTVTEPVAAQSAFIRKKRCIIDQNSQLFGNYVGQSLRDYIDKLKPEYKSEVTASTKQNWRKLLRASQDQLTACVGFLTQVAARVHDEHDVDHSAMTVSAITTGCPDVFRNITNNTTVQYLHTLSEFVLDRLHSKTFLFFQPEYAHFENEFPPDANAALFSLRATILEKSDLKELLRTRESLSRLITDVTSSNLSALLPRLASASPDTALLDLPHLYHYKEHPPKMLHVLLKVENFTTYLRFLHCLLSDIDSKAQVLRNEQQDAINDRPKYEELIPADYQPTVEHFPNAFQLDEGPRSLGTLHEPKPLQQVIEEVKRTSVGKVDCNTFASPRGHEGVVQAALARAGDIDWLDEWKNVFEDVDLKNPKSFKHVKRILTIPFDEQVDHSGNTLMHLAIKHGYNKLAEFYLEKTKARLEDNFSTVLRSALQVQNNRGVTIAHLIERMTIKDRQSTWRDVLDYFVAVDSGFGARLQ